MSIHVKPLMETPTAALARQVLLELRHARVRCDLAIVEIDTAAEMLAVSAITPRAALGILDDAMDKLAGVQP